MGEASRLLADPILLRLGLALVHFVWQGAALAGIAGLALMALRKAKPASRYLVLLAVMLAMVVCPVVTFTRVTAPDPAAVSARVAIARFAATHAPPTRARQGRTTPAPTFQPPPVSLRQRVSTPVLSSWQWLEPRLSWAVLTWALGVVLLSLRLLLRWRSLGPVRREGKALTEARWGEALARLIETVQVPRAVQLLQSSLARVPTTLGWLRPVILLPASALTGLTPRQLEAVIAHELAHIRRYDYLINLAQTVIETLLFYHPAVWWVSHRIRLEREHCCDELAVAACGNPRTYAAALVQLAHAQSLPMAVAASGGSLSARLHRLAGTRTRQHALASWIAAIPPALVVASLTLAPRVPAPAQPHRALGIYTGSPFVICQAEGPQVEEAVSGDIIVWTDFRKHPECDDPWGPRTMDSDIYGYDLRTKREFPICVAPGAQGKPAIDGNIVVWADFRNDSDGRDTPGREGDDNPDIYGYDLATRREFPVCTADGGQNIPAISGDLVVWEDSRTWYGGTSIWGRSLAGGGDFPICVARGNQAWPRVSGTMVVWMDFRNDPNGGWDQTKRGNADIYGRDLAGGPEFAICTNPFQQEYPSLSGRTVVWVDWRSDTDGFFTGDGSDNIDIYAYDLDQKREFSVSTALGCQESRALSGNRVAYLEPPGIVIHDLTSREETRLIGANTSWLALSGDMLVWAAKLDDKTGWDILGYRLPD